MKKKKFRDLVPGDQVWAYSDEITPVTVQKVTETLFGFVQLYLELDMVIAVQGLNTIGSMGGKVVSVSEEELITEVTGDLWKVIQELVDPKVNRENLREGDVVFHWRWDIVEYGNTAKYTGEEIPEGWLKTARDLDLPEALYHLREVLTELEELGKV